MRHVYIQALTDKINNALRDTKSASSLDTAAELDNLGAHLAGRDTTLGVVTLLKLQEVLGSEIDKAGANRLANEILRGLVLALLGDLDLELAASKAQLHDHVGAGYLVVRVGEVDRAASHVVVGAD